MDVAATPLPWPWVAVSALGAVLALAWAAWTAPWKRFASSESTHVWYGTIFALCVLWSVRAVVAEVVVIHLLGTAGFALAAGGPLALLGGAVVVVAVALIHATPVANIPLVFLCSVTLPVVVALRVLRLSQRYLPANFFVYVFVAGFAGPALGFAAAGLAGAAVLVAVDAAPADVVLGDYVPYLLYLGFAEGTLTGMLITMGIVYRPQWVATFDDARYLHHR